MRQDHVVKLGTQVSSEIRRRVQQTLHGHGGRKHDPLYQNLLWAGAERLTDCQRARLHAVFAVDRRVEGRVPPTSVSKSATDTPGARGGGT
jgi:hypothetical protein